jgi:hypothetical protein
VVPSGTVANRVRFLQNLAIPIISAPSLPVSNRPRENSRTGYGRRISNRFGPPALQTTNPDEQREIDTSHFFLGLNTPRTNHEKEHGITDNRSGYGRNIGIGAQIRPQGRVVGTQYDAAAPWGILSRRKSSRSTCRQCPSPDPDVLKEMDSSGNRSRFSAPVSISPTSQNEDPKSRDMHPREAKSRQGGIVGSEASFVTTSTIRRQSVRDLFKDYGIERPAGFASSEEPPKKADIAPRPTRLHRFCHICTGVDSGPSSQCWTKSSLPITRKEASLDYEETLSQEGPRTSTTQSLPKKNRLRDEETRKKLAKPYPTPLRPPVKQDPIAKVKKLSLPTKFLDFSEPRYPQNNGNQSPQRRISFGDQARPVPIQPGSQAGRCVKDSPFLVADSFSIKYSSVLPVGVRRGSQHSYHGGDSHRHKNYVGPLMPSSSSSDAADCSNSECRATHRGHAPYRHAIFCTRKKQNNRYFREETDNGYVADTSYTEECTPQLSHARLVDRRPSPRCEEEGGSDGHRLSDDEVVHEDKRKEVDKSLNNHDCAWKHKFLEGQNGQTKSQPNRRGLLGVTGITLVIHLEGREDLVINANSWKGGGLEIGSHSWCRVKLSSRGLGQDRVDSFSFILIVCGDSTV